MFGDWWVGLNADFAQSHISTLKSKDILFQFRSSSPLLKSKTRDLVANKYGSISTFIEYVPICSIYLVIFRQFHSIMLFYDILRIRKIVNHKFLKIFLKIDKNKQLVA